MLLVTYAAVLVAVVLLGAHTHKFVTMNHTRTQLIMSFVSGIMLGIAVFHLLPHALYASAGKVSIDFVALSLMLGLLTMFLLQRVFHFHQHDFEEPVAAAGQVGEHHLHVHEPVPAATELGGWGVFLGLSLHSLLDGVALAASIQIDRQIATQAGVAGVAGLAGIGVFLAIFLHKPLDAMTVGMFMQRQGVGATVRISVLVAYGLLCPLAAGLILYGLPAASAAGPVFIVGALAFSAGIFLCIALSDLLPEIHFHSHDRGKMTLFLLLGIALSYSLKQIESVHSHDAVLPSAQAPHAEAAHAEVPHAEVPHAESPHVHPRR